MQRPNSPMALHQFEYTIVTNRRRWRKKNRMEILQVKRGHRFMSLSNCVLLVDLASAHPMNLKWNEQKKKKRRKKKKKRSHTQQLNILWCWGDIAIKKCGHICYNIKHPTAHENNVTLADMLRLCTLCTPFIPKELLLPLLLSLRTSAKKTNTHTHTRNNNNKKLRTIWNSCNAFSISKQLISVPNWWQYTRIHTTIPNWTLIHFN